MVRWRVKEEGTASAVKPRIDKAKGIIYNVLILGRGALNGRKYTTEAMEDALAKRKYENLQVYIGPHKKSRFAKRSPKDHAGELRNIRLTDDGLRGDLLYNRASKGGRLVVEIAERFPNRFGLSHHADIAGYMEGDQKIITRILEVTVVDIVKDPATTEGVFEEVEIDGKRFREVATEDDNMDKGANAGVMPDVTEDDDADTGEGGWQQCLKDLVSEIHDDDSIDDAMKLKATKALLKLKGQLNGDDEDDSDEDADESAEDDDEADEEATVKPKKRKKATAMEAVDIVRLVQRAVAKVIKRKPTRPRKNKPRSSARNDAAEEATRRNTATAALPSKREDILAFYTED